MLNLRLPYSKLLSTKNSGIKAIVLYLISNKTIISKRIELIKKDGSLITTLLSASIIYNESQDIEYIEGNIIDITDLVLAEKMINGETIRNRNKRSMAISALRSWLFNEMLHSRLKNGCLNKALPGDVMQLAGSHSFFCAEQLDEATLSRIQQQDIYLTAPLWGCGQLASQSEALQFEQGLAQLHPAVTKTLEELGLKQERRATNLFPKDLKWSLQQNVLNLSFSLPTGTFATSVLRELLDLQDDSHSES